MFEHPTLTIQTRPGTQHKNADALSRLVTSPSESQTGAKFTLEHQDGAGHHAGITTVKESPEQGHTIEPARFNLTTSGHTDVLGDCNPVPVHRAHISWRSTTWYDAVVRELQLPEKERSRDVAPFTLHGNVLLRGDVDGVAKVCVHPSKVRDTIESAHKVGHFSGGITLLHLRALFWWPQMYSDVHRFVRTCESCQKHGAPAKKNRYNPMVVTQPFDVIQVDFATITPPSQRGHVGIITAIDHFTGFTLAEAVLNMQADTARDFLLRKVFLTFGVPTVVYTDRGNHFSGEFGELLLESQVRHVVSTPYYAEAHGKVERAHKLILDRLRRYPQGDWERYLAMAVFAVNSRKTETYPFSPLELLTGVRPRGALDVQVVNLFRSLGIEGDAGENEIWGRLRRLGIIRDYHNSHMAKLAHKWTKDRLDDLRPGDEVLITDDRKKYHRKLEARWKGPFVVTAIHKGGIIETNGRRYPRHRVKCFERLAEISS